MYIQKQHWEGSCDRIIIAAPEGHATVQVDILLTEYQKKRYKADALLRALWVEQGFRNNGEGSNILEAAEEEAEKCGCNSIALEWNEKEAPLWVHSWYERNGYEEKVFGKGYSLMVKNLR